MMIARPQPDLKKPLVVICPGFATDRIRRQPWHVADGLARGMLALGHEATLITDAHEAGQPLPYGVKSVPNLLVGGAVSPDLRTAIDRLAPERIYLVTGASQLARLRGGVLGAPLSLVMASPKLTLREIGRLGPLDLWRERQVLLLPLLNALCPPALLRAGLARSGADEIVYLSPSAQNRFAAAGLPPGRLMLPRIDPDAVIATPAPGSGLTVCYFGPPLATRGADLALAAFEAAVSRGLDARLLMLLRPDSGGSSIDRLVARIERSPCRQRIEFRAEMLAAPLLRRELARCHAFLLPFRVTISEVPLVVIESCLSGRPTIVLEAPGVSEVARRLGGIVAGSPAELADALMTAAARPASVPAEAAAWIDWRRAVAPLLDPVDPPLAAYRMVALCGVDGSGKTFLLNRLAARLDEAGVAHRHVWSRFRNYLSKPFLALTRFTGHNRKEVTDGVSVGYHDFAGRPWLAWPFLLLQVVDGVLDAWWRYGRVADRRLILADRCLYDTLVDVAVDTGLDEVLLGPLGRWLVDRLPAPRLVVMVERPIADIHASRPDVPLDRRFARRRAVYRRLARELSLPVLENAGSADVLLDRLERLAASFRTGKGASS